VIALGCGGRELPIDAVAPDVPADASSDASSFSCAMAMMDAYMPNMTKVGTKGLFTFQLVESRPAPPQRGNNTFLVRVLQVSRPVLVELSVVTFFGRTPVRLGPTVTLDAASLTYTVDPVYLFASGQWKIEMLAAPPGADAGPVLDETFFSFCVDG
jgi:hypothetical protein